MVCRMNTASESYKLTIAIVSLLFTHGIAEAMQSLAKCHDSAARVDAAVQIARVLRSGRFISDDPDRPVVLAAPDWQVQPEQFYELWVDVMDGRVVSGKPTMSVANEIVRSGFAAVFIAAFVDERGPSDPLSAEALYDIYANGQYKPFSKLGEPARRAWLAVATAIARLNGQFDPSPGNMTLPSVVAALGLVTERFGPPKLVAA
jgi:hypothetical protein